MNATIYRLRKELTGLAPAFFLFAFLLPAAAYVAFDDLEAVMGGFLLATVVLATVPFSSEWEDGTLEGLLSQPVSRRRIWWEKVAAAAVAMGVLTFLYFPLLVRSAGLFPMVIAHLAACGLFLGPALATACRRVYLVFGVAAPLALVAISLMVAVGVLVDSTHDVLPARGALRWVVGSTLLGLVPLVLAGSCFLLARTAFEVRGTRLLRRARPARARSDRGGVRGVLRFRFPLRFRFRGRGVSAALVGAELQLQAGPAGGALLGLVLLAFAAWFDLDETAIHRLDLSGGILVAYMVAFPLVVTGVSVNGGRLPGLRAWMSGQPVCARRGWYAKAGVCYLVSAVFGAVLPVAVLAVLGLAGRSTSVFVELGGWDLGWWDAIVISLVFNVLVTSLTLFTATAFSRPVEGLVLSALLMVVNFLAWPMLFLALEVLVVGEDLTRAPRWWDGLRWVPAFLGVAATLVAIHVLAFRNYRFDPPRRPVAAAQFAVVSAAAGVWWYAAAVFNV